MVSKSLLKIAEESELYQQGSRNIPLNCSSRGLGRSEGPMLENYMRLQTNCEFVLKLLLRLQPAITSLYDSSCDLGILALESCIEIKCFFESFVAVL